MQTDYLPIFGSCPPKTGDIILESNSVSQSCTNNICNVSLQLTLKNYSLETINVTKIEKWVNDSLITTYNSGDVLGDLESGASKSFSMTLNSATSGQIKVFWSYGGKNFTVVYDWTP